MTYKSGSQGSNLLSVQLPKLWQARASTPSRHASTSQIQRDASGVRSRRVVRPVVGALKRVPDLFFAERFKTDNAGWTAPDLRDWS